MGYTSYAVISVIYLSASVRTTWYALSLSIKSRRDSDGCYGGIIEVTTLAPYLVLGISCEAAHLGSFGHLRHLRHLPNTDSEKTKTSTAVPNE